MNTLRLGLPESLHDSVGELARQEGISINQFITTAVAEKVSALKTLEYLQDRAIRGTREAFDRALAKVPDVEALPGDELPATVGTSPPSQQTVKPARTRRVRRS
ncbi:MAG: hypothetical protein DIJKHBIC_02125 [Thermoanaerobaculia bacterium]|nr:hypothetical protein [Thermoanaerobaculia bacterium]